MELSRQDHWSRLPFATPGDLPDSGIEPASLESPPLAGGLFANNATWEALYVYTHTYFFLLIFFCKYSLNTILHLVDK